MVARRNSCYITNFLQASIGRSYYLDIKQNLFCKFVCRGSAPDRTGTFLVMQKGTKNIFLKRREGLVRVFEVFS